MTFPQFIDRMQHKAHPALAGGLGCLILLGGLGYAHLQQKNLQALQSHLTALTQAERQSGTAQNHYQALADLKTQDVEEFKAGMSDLAQSKKTLFEAGLSAQEERRLLEKQWEILTTYLTVQTVLQRIFLMRGDQPLESYLVGYVPLKALGGLPASVPRIVRIISKERFAHPERGKSELINGKLQWEPPQVGSSIRSNALGEYVLFTNSHLILHGTPKNPAAHEAFPHLCLGLTMKAAQNLYLHSFIGSKILLSDVKDELERQQAASFAVSLDTTTKEPNGH